MSEPRPMETMHDAVERLRRRGFEASFRARPEGLLEVGSDRVYAPEELVVEEIVRFEGESDPGDEGVLFALRSADRRVRGTFASAFGANADPVAAELMRRLPRSAPEPRTPAAATLRP